MIQSQDSVREHLIYFVALKRKIAQIKQGQGKEQPVSPLFMPPPVFRSSIHSSSFSFPIPVSLALCFSDAFQDQFWSNRNTPLLTPFCPDDLPREFMYRSNLRIEIKTLTHANRRSFPSLSFLSLQSWNNLLLPLSCWFIDSTLSRPSCESFV